MAASHRRALSVGVNMKKTRLEYMYLITSKKGHRDSPSQHSVIPNYTKIPLFTMDSMSAAKYELGELLGKG